MAQIQRDQMLSEHRSFLSKDRVERVRGAVFMSLSLAALTSVGSQVSFLAGEGQSKCQGRAATFGACQPLLVRCFVLWWEGGPACAAPDVLTYQVYVPSVKVNTVKSVQKRGKILFAASHPCNHSLTCCSSAGK